MCVRVSAKTSNTNNNYHTCSFIHKLNLTIVSWHIVYNRLWFSYLNGMECVCVCVSARMNGHAVYNSLQQSVNSIHQYRNSQKPARHSFRFHHKVESDISSLNIERNTFL